MADRTTHRLMAPSLRTLSCDTRSLDARIFER
jgi:hypothetical protein